MDLDVDNTSNYYFLQDNNGLWMLRSCFDVVEMCEKEMVKNDQQ